MPTPSAPVSLLRAGTIYTFAGGVASLVPLLLLPVLTRHLATDSYGIVAMYSVLTNAYAVFVGLGVHGAINRRYFDDRFDFPAYVASSLAVIGVGAVITGVLTLLVGPALAKAVHFPERWMGAVWLTALCLSVMAVGQSVWQSAERPHRFATLQLALAISFFCLTIWFVVGMGWDWQGRVSGQLLSVALIAAVTLFLLRRGAEVKMGVRRSYVKDALTYCLPLVPHMLGGFVIGLADRIVLVRYAGLSETGIYVAGAQLAAMLTILSSAINNAWIPWFYRQVGRNDIACDIKIVKATYVISAGYLLVAGLAWLLGDVVVEWLLGAEYQTSARVLPLLALALALDGIYKLMAGYFFYYEKLQVLYRITLAAAVVNITTLFVGITCWGAFGAALAMLATYVFFAVTTGWAARQLRPMPWLYWRR